MPTLATSAERDDAVRDLMHNVYADSAATAVGGRRRCYARMLSLWSLPPLPLTADKVMYLGAGLRAGGYRSASSVLSQYRTDSTRAGSPPDLQAQRAFADAARACRRGQGPPLRALALDVQPLTALTSDDSPWSASGPVGPRNLLIVGSWWLLREMEASGARAAHAQIVPGTPLVATLLLPASKTDTAAMGAARAHPCICGSGRPRADCPVHALWDQLLGLRRRFPEHHRQDQPLDSLPLFPTAAGKVVSKAAVVQTILEAANRTGQEKTNADRTLRLSGHTLRATGAQHLARRGLDLISIQLLGRWGSSALLSYVRGAAVSVEAARARGGGSSQTVRDLTRAAAAADLPAPQSDDFKAATETWFNQWFADAVGPLRASFSEEVAEKIAAAAARRQRTSSSGSTSTSSSSSSSAAAPQGGVAVPPAIADLRSELAASPVEPSPAAARAPASEQPESPVVASCALGLVGNSKRKRVHCVVIGPPAPPEDWRTHCTWRFGRSKFAVQPELDFRQCDRCSDAMGQNWGALLQ